MNKKSKRQPLERHYVSELDRFLQEFDKKPEAYSDSRLAEQAQYETIAKLRDYPNTDNPGRDNPKRDHLNSDNLNRDNPNNDG